MCAIKSEWVNEWINEWRSEWISEVLKEWVSERVCVCVCVCVSIYEAPGHNDEISWLSNFSTKVTEACWPLRC